MPTTRLFACVVVCAGITLVLVCAERSDTATVPSRTACAPDHARIPAPHASPEVPVVWPDQTGDGVSADVPSAIRVKT